MSGGKYALYYTLNTSLKSNDLTISEKKLLKKNIDTLGNDAKEAILMLICEYAKDKDNYKFDLESIVLPYKIKHEDANGTKVEIEIENLPNQLKHLLMKFIKLSQK
jgi:hypothetical protein